MKYEVIDRPAEKIRRVRVVALGDIQIWTLTKVRAVAKKCALCNEPIEPKEFAWSPLTFKRNRMDRVHHRHWR